jgi:hypothetical protein
MIGRDRSRLCLVRRLDTTKPSRVGEGFVVMGLFHRRVVGLKRNRSAQEDMPARRSLRWPLDLMLPRGDLAGSCDVSRVERESEVIGHGRSLNGAVSPGDGRGCAGGEPELVGDSG